MTPNSSSSGSVVPRDYNELHSQYGALILRLLKKYNKVERNFEDLHSYVWMKILEAKLLDRFKAKIEKQRPKVLTAIEVCDVLGVSWLQWQAAMAAYHRGTPRLLINGVPAIYVVGNWMPTPINLAEFEGSPESGYLKRQALFSIEDIHYLTTIPTALRLGQDVRGGVLYERVRGERLKWPSVKATRAQFKNYLAFSVLNHFANFCRTQERRHKERPYLLPTYEDGDAVVWESTIADVNTPDCDTMISLAEAKEILLSTLTECSEDEELCKPLETHRSEVLAFLGGGAKLMQALRDSELPPRVRRTVVDVLKAEAPNFS